MKGTVVATDYKVKYTSVKCWASGPDGEVAVIGIRDDGILLAYPIKRLKEHMTVRVSTITHEEWKEFYHRK